MRAGNDPPTQPWPAGGDHSGDESINLDQETPPTAPGGRSRHEHRDRDERLDESDAPLADE